MISVRNASQKSDLLEALCRFVLVRGLTQASLRPMAQAVGTSDRMLIYHFGSKDGLVAAVLTRLAADLEAVLTDALPRQEGIPLEVRITTIVAMLRSPPLQGYMRVWLDIVAAARLGNVAYQKAGRGILQGFLAWLEGQLPLETPDKPRTAAAVLALIEGTMVFDAVGLSDAADIALTLGGRLG
jgi:AcrR family transcriptional regulator